MNNKKMGNHFEQELCDRLFDLGFWVHMLNANKAGQPADIVAVRNKIAHLIDAKVCTNATFPLSRVEENQDLAMKLWEDCGNGLGWFALKLGDEIHMVSYYVMKSYKGRQHSLSASEIAMLGKPLEKWVKSCK